MIESLKWSNKWAWYSTYCFWFQSGWP